MKSKGIFTLIALVVLTGGILFAILNLFNSKTVDTNKTNEIPGLKIEVLKKGTGDREVKNGDKIAVNYSGKLENGTEFDSSYKRNTPFEFTIGNKSVIDGWEKGILGMKVGEKRKLTISPDLGYGAYGNPPTIPGNATLIFEVELVSFK